MTDLIPPEEWQRNFWRRVRQYYGPGPEPKSGADDDLKGAAEQRAVFRDIQRNALEAAAKAACDDCRLGEPPVLVDAIWWHVGGPIVDGRRAVVWCRANPIRLLIPNDPPPAQADKDEPEKGDDGELSRD